MNVKVNWQVDADDVGVHHKDYDSYVITSINTDDNKKEILDVTYSYIWSCGDGCCSDTEIETAYVGDLADWVKERILEKLPGYHFEGTTTA